ncbi:MAG TPA: thioredoxin family protein [Terriglobia bacterium]|nr:thioredoxin family protein [Terriglobia bacterium]
MILGFLFLALIVGGAATHATPASQSIYDGKADAASDIRGAVGQASRQHKNVVLVFGANWCGDCHALDEQMHRPELASLIAKNYVVVKIDVGRFDKNVALAEKYHVPLEQGIPAVAVLDSRGKLLHAQEQGEFANARQMDAAAFQAFFKQWKPKG